MTDDRIVTVDLIARPTTWDPGSGAIEGFGYNGTVPGPTIEARVGDTLVIRFTNELPEPTTIHWHGLRVPAAMDGTEATQRPIEPGETFEYRFGVPDAGTFWYHPHANETEQLEKGLYGALIVRAADEPVLDAERVLILDDVLVGRDGSLAAFGGRKQRHDGRRGEVRLLNGRADARLQMAAGQTERWRIINASSSRYIRLSIGGRPFTIIGTDGGLIERPMSVSDFLLAAADRIDIAVGPFEESETFRIEALPYDRGMLKEHGAVYGTVDVGAPAPSNASIPARLRTIEPLANGDATPNRIVHLGGKMSLRRGVDWMIEGEAHHQADPVRVGELQIWDVVNETRQDHPFHLHGFFFQILEENGKPPAFASWEDTVNVPARGSVRIAWLPDDRPGEWMYHCHILEHHAAGMMAHFKVIP